jgi:hypothetical protein
MRGMKETPENKRVGRYEGMKKRKSKEGTIKACIRSM